MKKFFTTRLNRKKFFLYTLPITWPLCLLPLYIIEILFGGGAIFGITVIDIVMNILNIFEGFLPGLVGLFCLLVFPSLIIRRLHDLGMSGWKGLLLLIPVINVIPFIVLLLKIGEKATNKWGDPV